MSPSTSDTPYRMVSCRQLVRCVGALLLVFLLGFSHPADAQSGRETENVVLVTLDGLRWQEVFTGADSTLLRDERYVENVDALAEQFWRETPGARREALMPFFWDVVAEHGQLYGNRRRGCSVSVANDMVFSYPGYNEILTGAPDDGRINSNQKIPNPNVTVLEVVNQQPGFQGRVAAFGSWDVFPYIVNEERSGVPVNAGFEGASGENLTQKQRFLNELQKRVPSPWSSVRLDAFTQGYALEYFKKHWPRLLYVAYGETDDFAHDGNYEAYLEAAHRTDHFIRELWELVQSNPPYRDKTTLIVTTDHGRGLDESWTDHGSEVDRSDEIWMAVMGPDTPALGEVASYQLYANQVARTVAAFLGLNLEGDPEAGKVIHTALE